MPALIDRGAVRPPLISTMVKWGVLATGGIANDFSCALQAEGSDRVAVASRRLPAAEAFAKRFGFRRAHGSYEALVADVEVEVVYIATPHSHHYDNVRLCLNAGKHVVCEKPLCATYWQTEECVALAKAKGLFLLEGMWSRFFPAHKQVKEWCADGSLGDIVSVRASFGFKSPPDPNPRLFQPELAGGGTLDVGIYPICFALMVLGEPKQVIAHGRVNKYGTDDYASITLVYNHGRVAQLECGTNACLGNTAVVAGTNGRAVIPNPVFHATENAELTALPSESSVDPLLLQAPVQRFTEPLNPSPLPQPYADAAPGYKFFNSQGFVYQVRAVESALKQGKRELAEMPHAHTLAAARIMQEVRRQLGVRYPWDRSSGAPKL